MLYRITISRFDSLEFDLLLPKNKSSIFKHKMIVFEIKKEGNRELTKSYFGRNRKLSNN